VPPTDDPEHVQSPEARFGAELRRLREHAGLTVRRLADELHRAHSGIVEWERGRRLPGVDVVEQYEDYFGLKRGTLVSQRERARIERLERPRDGTLPEHLGEAVCPYMGLRAFQSEDASLFFGREQQVEEVLDDLSTTRFVAVVGASGSGKSSFVGAGLMAGIRSRGGDAEPVRVVLLTPGEHPTRELTHTVAAATGEAPDALAKDLPADPDTLAQAIASAAAQPLVIVVDQFEELFTLCDEEPDRRCFVDALIGAWRDPSSPVSVIIALRADFYGRIAA
jgi:transcriptional regulator with XRE-family HTH domain